MLRGEKIIITTSFSQPLSESLGWCCFNDRVWRYTVSVFKHSRPNQTEGCQRSARWRLVERSSDWIGWLETFWRRNPNRSWIPSWLLYLSTPHQCIFSSQVDARGLHGLSCRKSVPRHVRHSLIKDILWIAITNQKCADSSMQVAKWFIKNRRKTAGRCNFNSLVTRQVTSVARDHIRYIFPVTYYSRCRANTPSWATPTDSPLPLWKQDVHGVELVQEIRKMITTILSKQLQTRYLFQCISVAVQRGNALKFLNTFTIDRDSFMFNMATQSFIHSELLCFVQNNLSNCARQSLVTSIYGIFTVDEITKAKDLLFKVSLNVVRRL